MARKPQTAHEDGISAGSFANRVCSHESGTDAIDGSDRRGDDGAGGGDGEGDDNDDGDDDDGGGGCMVTSAVKFSNV